MDHDVPGTRAPDSHAHAAIGAVLDFAQERAGHLPGFDALLSFMSWEQLADLDASFTYSPFLTREELTQRLQETYGGPGGTLRMIALVVRVSLRHADELNQNLAERIATRMSQVSTAGTRVKPRFYMLSTAEGAAVAVVVHEAFWNQD